MSTTPPAQSPGNGAVQKAQAFARQRPIVAGVVGLIILCVMCGACGSLVQGISGNSGSTSTASVGGGASPTAKVSAAPTATYAPTATPKPTSTPKPSYAQFSDGTFQVGKDIQPGTYRTRVGSPGCYWARLSGFGGSVGEIIANDNTDAPAVVTIAASDKGFQSQDCGTWTKDLSQITQSKTSFGDGTFIVGTDITPGTYKNTGVQGCYYARLSGFGGTLGDIISNNNVDSVAIVTIAASDKGFQSSGCGTWTKQ